MRGEGERVLTNFVPLYISSYFIRARGEERREKERWDQ